MRQRYQFSLYGGTFIIAVSFAVYTLYYVDHLPTKVTELRPRRLSIAELVGQIDDTDLSTDPHHKQRQNEVRQTDNRPQEGQVGPEKERQDAMKNENKLSVNKPLVNNLANNLPRDRNLAVQIVTGHPQNVENLRGDQNLGNNNGANVNQGLKQSVIKQEPMPGTNVRQSQIIPSGKRPRIFCMLFTTLSTWATRAKAVRDTWVQRCDVYRFFYTSHEGRTLPEGEAVALPVEDGRNHLTAKTMTGLKWAYENYEDSIDWFFKADDDTFVIMENLRFVAAQFKPTEAHYIGGRSTDLLKHGYNGGGAGYLLSTEAARLIVKESQRFPKTCKNDGEVEDLDIGKCMETFNVYPIDTRDSSGRLTFHPDHPYKIFAKLGDNARVYTYRLRNGYHGNPRGIRTMSPHTVSFHYVTPDFMYMYDFLLYHLIRHDETGENGIAPPPYTDSVR